MSTDSAIERGALDRPPTGLPGPLAAAWGGLVTGAAVGVGAGLVDGLLALAGADPSMFLLRWRIESLGAALRSGAVEGGALELAPCVAAAGAVYGALGAGAGMLVALAARVALRRPSAREVRRATLGLLLGAWVFVELFWWTRPVVLPGLASTDPRRLLASGGLLLVGLALGMGLARLLGAAGPRLRAAVPWASAAVLAAGGARLALGAVGDAGRGRIDERTRDLPNVVVFVVDALRQDVLGCYGATDVATPVIDGLAEQGVVFEEAFVQAPFTWTSFGSFLTGKYPRRHGLLRMAPGVRMAPNETLALHLDDARRRSDGVALRDGDYLCGAFMTGTLSHGSGLLEGFDVYLEAMVGHELVDVHDAWSRFRSHLTLFQVRNKVAQHFDAELVATTARRWIGAHADRRFLALVHYYSTHTPYDPPAEYRERYLDPSYRGPISAFYAAQRIAIEQGLYALTEADRRRIRDLYRAGVTQADAMVGEVVGELERRGILDDTIVVVTSDHGEELGDHDLWEHNFMYQTNLRIPLVMRWPPGLPAGTRVPALVDSIDLVPTLCDLMGLEPPDDPSLGERGRIDGASLVPLVRGEAQGVREHSFAENGRYVSVQSANAKLIVRREALEPGGWERLVSGELETPRFFDLERDPDERHNAFHEDLVRARALYDVLLEWSASLPIGEHVLLRSERDLEAEEVWRALGYGGGVGEDEEDEGAEAPR